MMSIYFDSRSLFQWIIRTIFMLLSWIAFIPIRSDSVLRENWQKCVFNCFIYWIVPRISSDWSFSITVRVEGWLLLVFIDQSLEIESCLIQFMILLGLLDWFINWNFLLNVYLRHVSSIIKSNSIIVIFLYLDRGLTFRRLKICTHIHIIILRGFSHMSFK
jgi:hypothetical protein